LVNSRLKELDLGGINYLSIAGAMQLGQALSHNSTMEWLTVGEHRLPLMALRGQQRVSSLGGPIEEPPTTLDLRLAENKKSYQGMHDEMAIVVLQLLKENAVLTSLRLSQAECPLPVQKLIGKNLIHDSVGPPWQLDLSNQGYGSVDAIIIGGLVADNPFLRVLSLQGNDFAATEGENWIANALTTNVTLKLDKRKWPVRQMYTDGYKALASLKGLSASGAIIEPQRLEGW